MDQEQLMQIVKAFIAEQTGAQSEELVMLVIQQLQQEGKLEEVAQQAMLWAQQQLGGTQMARHGAKLDYIKKLKGICPEGQELKSFKVGGKICKKCIAKEKGGNIPEPANKGFKRDDSKRIMKCGGKAKK